MAIGAGLVKKTVDLLLENKIEGIDQSQFVTSQSELKPAPKIFKETCEIDTSSSVESVHNFVRGLSPYPAAWIVVQFPNQPDKMMLKVYETEKEQEVHTLPVGTLVTDGKKFAKIALADGFILLKSVQLAGKKRMDIGELLRGLR